VAVDSVVVVGASAGGIEALRGFLAGLAPDLPAAVLVVVHRGADGPPALHRVLARSTDLPVALAAQGEPLVAGQVRVAVPDLHLVVEDGAVALVDGPKENRQRPAVDPLLRSAARWYGSHTLAVVQIGRASCRERV